MVPTNQDFALLVLVWLITSLVLLAFCWKRRKLTIGLSISYTGFLSVTHILQGLVYLMPWYTPLHDPSDILLGFSYSTLAFVCFAIGTIVIYPFFRNPKWHQRRVNPRPVLPSIQTILPPKLLAATYLVTGFVGYFVFRRIFADVPTLSAFVSSLKHLLPIGTIMTLWINFKGEKIKWNSVAPLIVLSIIWPLVTIASDGFLGFGFMTTLIIVIFLLLQLKRLRFFTILGLIIAYLGISVFATYFMQRNDIRAVVWRDAAIESRTQITLDSVVGRFELFDPMNPEHLATIDKRLTQNYLVGLGVQRIESRMTEPAYGQTLIDGLLMLIPRAVWLDKPLVVGGQALVNKYTGVSMYGGTSVSLGPVLELFVNFGILGVVGGFLILGVIVRTIDEKIVVAFQNERFMDAALWFALAFAVVLTEDNFITIISAGVSAFLTLYIFNHALILLLSRGVVPVYRKRLN